MAGNVVKGFQRGSKQLGVPTANIEMTKENQKLTANLIPGVYAAMGTFPRTTKDFIDPAREYPCSLSIGWNPTYDNAEKTIEAFIVHDLGDNDFYDEFLSVEIKHFLRAEALYPGVDALVLAI